MKEENRTVFRCSKPSITRLYYSKSPVFPEVDFYDTTKHATTQRAKVARPVNRRIERGATLKTANRKVVSGYGEMSAVEIVQLGVNSSFNMHLEGYNDYFENDLRALTKPVEK